MAEFAGYAKKCPYCEWLRRNPGRKYEELRPCLLGDGGVEAVALFDGDPVEATVAYAGFRVLRHCSRQHRYLDTFSTGNFVQRFTGRS